MFYDRKRLQDGEDFRLAFMRAMTNSLGCMPIVSHDALRRIMGNVDNPSVEDNVLLEWTLMGELYRLGAHVSLALVLSSLKAHLLLPPSVLLTSTTKKPKKRSKKIQFILPILIGSEFEEVGGSKVPACAFSWDLLAKLPELVPTAVLDLSWEALLRNEITPDSSEEVFKRQTVKDIVSGMVRNNLNK